jgi:hypothetical protein
MPPHPPPFFPGWPARRFLASVASAMSRKSKETFVKALTVQIILLALIQAV